MSNQSFLNQIRRLRDLDPIDFQRRVCINPMWFNGPRQEVVDSFDRLSRALAYDNHRLNELIDEVKRTRYVEEIGKKKLVCTFKLSLSCSHSSN